MTYKSLPELTAADICVRESFRNRIPQPSQEERERLEENIVAEGAIRDPLAVWRCDDDLILLDGHNRRDIAERHGLPFSVIEIEVSDEESALDWIDRNQLGRRNLSADDFKLISGRIFNRRKAKQGGDRKSRKSKHQVDVLKSTAEVVAEELGVSPATIERNGQRAAVVDEHLAAGDIEAAEAAKKAPQKEIAKWATKDKPKKPKAKKGKKAEQPAAPKPRTFGPSPVDLTGTLELAAKRDAERRKSMGLPPAAPADTTSKKPTPPFNGNSDEWYTPAKFVESSRRVLGTIDLDPASCDLAQKTVKAETFYTLESNGLKHDWKGNVFLNPPYSTRLIGKFIDKLFASSGDVKAAIVLVNNCTETKWCQLLLERSNAICFPGERIKFRHAQPQDEPRDPPRGSAFFYVGPEPEKFCKVFSQFGWTHKTKNAARAMVENPSGAAQTNDESNVF